MFYFPLDFSLRLSLRAQRKTFVCAQGVQRNPGSTQKKDDENRGRRALFARLHLVRLGRKSRLEPEERRLAEKKNIKAYCNATTDKERAEMAWRGVPVIGNSKRKWFEIDQEVKYRTVYGEVLAEGTGRTVNMSSGGVWFTTEGSSPLTSGMLVELAIHWPVLLNYTCPMKLMILRPRRAQPSRRDAGGHRAIRVPHAERRLYHVAPGR